MSTPRDKLIADVLTLPREARALLAERLLESLDFEEDFEVSEAWREEIAQRCRELDDGSATIVSEDEAFSRARQGFRR